MTLEEIKLRRLARQHLLTPTDTQTVVKDLCGVQAQFLSHALHSLSIRCAEVNPDGLVKSFLRPVDTLESDSYISADRKAYFAELIVDAVAQGIDQREALKAVREKAGMTENESQSLFDPWGGTIRALCEVGRLCHKVQEKKAYQLSV